MLKDAAMLFWLGLGLVKQALPSRDSCWLASANGAGAGSSPGEGRGCYRLLSCPKTCSSSSSKSGSSRCRGTVVAAPSSRAAELAACSRRREQLAVPYSCSSGISSSSVTGAE